MGNRSNVDTGELYAQLTALFEDAATKAVEGQAPDVDQANASVLIQNMRQMIVKANDILDQISAQSSKPG